MPSVSLGGYASISLRLGLYATVAALGMGSAGKAMAQPSQDTASSGLEEIVVTARRREERVQTIPLAITAFNQKAIEQDRITQVKDLTHVVPSLANSRLASDANAPSTGNIRLRGLAGSVTYFADVPIGSTDYFVTNQLSHGSGSTFFYDLDNVEVIKGPQGTLFGKNSIGGLISIEPKKPTDNFEGYVQGTFGNYSDREFDAAVNVPIVADKLLVRIAGHSQQRDGYTKDVSDGKDLDNRDNYNWRVGVTLRPSDDFENYFLYDGYYQHTNGSSLIPTFVNPAFTFAQIKLAPKLSLPLTLGNGPSVAGLSNPATAAATAAAGIRAGAFSFFPGIEQALALQQQLGVRAIAGLSNPGLAKDYDYGFTDTIRWDLADNLTLKNVAAARIFKNQTTEDYWGGPQPLLFVGDPKHPVGQLDNSAQYTEELQLQGKSLDDKLTWVLGGFLEFDHPLGDNNNVVTTLGTTTYTHISTTNRSQALFAHGIYDLDDYVSGLKFTAGYRYTWDFVSLTELGLNKIDHIERTDGVGSNCTLIGFDRNCSVGSNDHFSSYGWNLSLDEQLDQDTLLYVRSGNAYRPGGTNPQVPIQFQSLKPEHVTDVEIGAKVDWELFGAHLRTNADLYHTDYKAIQVQQNITVINAQGGASSQSVYTNAASAYLEGGEFEATVVPFTGFELAPHAAYIYTHYDKYPNAANQEAPPFMDVPKWEYGITGTYHLPLDPSVGDIAIQMTYTFIGQMFNATLPVGEIYPYLPSNRTLDARIDWTNAFESPIDLAFFMTNVTDTVHPSGAIALYPSLGYTSLTYNEPRMFGFSVKYRFGGPSEPESTPAAYVPPPVVAPAPSPKSYLVFFDFNKSDLTSQAVSIVNQAASNAGPAHVTQLTVTGHTDTVGSDAYNMRLSRRRAESVATQLEKDGIPSSEIQIVAKGKRDLLVPTSDGVKEPQNRRVQIVYDGAGVS